MESHTFEGIDDMLGCVPDEAGEVAIEKWEMCQNPTFAMHMNIWQGVSPDLPFPNDSYNEWTDGNGKKFFGMRNAAGQVNGILRSIASNGTITEATKHEGESHGLAVTWSDKWSGSPLL